MVQTCGVGASHRAHDINTELDLVQTSKMNPHVAQHVDSAQHAMQERIDDLQQQIRQSGDPSEKMALENEIMGLEEAFDAFKGEVAKLSADLPGLVGKLAGNVLDKLNAPALREAVSDFRNLIAESYQDFGTANMPAQSFCGTMAIHEPVTMGSQFPHLGIDLSELTRSLAPLITPDVKAQIVRDAPGAESVEKSDGASKSEGSAQADGARESGEAEKSDFNASEMLELFNDDPMAFYDQLGSMSPEDRNTAMMMIQNEMQQINQMFSMVSNLAKSMHDTSKAMINNMRV